jgi:hypothetical protein
VSGQHCYPRGAAAVEFTQQLAHACLHLLAARVQVEGDRSLDKVLLAHVQVVRTAGDQLVPLRGDLDRNLPGGLSIIVMACPVLPHASLGQCLQYL